MTILVTFWAGESLSHFEQLCLRSFLSRGHEVELYAYERPRGAPAGVTHRDAGEFLPLDDVVTELLRRGLFARVSDILRYRLLAQPARTWVDVDVHLIAEDLPRGEVLFGREDEHYIANGVLRLQPDSELRQRLVEETSRLDIAAAVRGDHGAFGPLLLTRLVDELGMRDLAVPPTTLYPIPSRDVWRLFDPRERRWVQAALDGSSAFHLWNEFLRRAQLRAVRPPRGSWLDRAMRSEGIALPSESADLAWIRGPWRQELPDPPPVPQPRPPRLSPRKLAGRIKRLTLRAGLRIRAEVLRRAGR
jgi:hypothetical protein